MWWVIGVWCAAVACVRACELHPGEGAGEKSPGDNYYRVIINGDVERYSPEQRYVVTLVGSRTHDVVQQFTRFQLLLDPLDPASPRTPRKQGQFQLFADTLSKFDEICINSVIEADDLPKTEVQVMWKAPPAGSGCVLIKAMVYENDTRWFAGDGQLTRRVCEELPSVDCCACDDAKYSMVFEGLWSPQTHPKDFPVQALWLTHFSDVIGATHIKNFSFWGEGEIATDGFRSLAEWGSVGLLERELQQHGPGPLRSIVKAAGLWHPRLNLNTSATFTVDRKRHLLSLASMFGPSPDWVVGVSGLDLCNKDCTWTENKVIDLFPYDAGTDNGISYMSPNSETKPREEMYRITNMYPEDPRAPFYNPANEIMNPMARLYLKRESLISRACDQEVLLSMLVEEQENTRSVETPECAVSPWGSWSPCSVSCGKGLRMRTREYRMPQKAQMFQCDRQLVSKEMCVADVPECPEGGALESDASFASEVDVPVCRTTEWSSWGECSVTCGVGLSTRKRTFIDHKGFKKCPLVHIEDTRKCMEPPCPEGEDSEVSDPECPTTEWSSLSPCSASCGRGVSYRTRLLLVPADRQRYCGARVELLQQRPCSDRDDCTIDMITAKRICMELPEAGPCRGVYSRWAFSPLKGMCVPFNYGGCRGNRNNFISQEDCTNTCSVLLATLSNRILGGGPPSSVPSPTVSVVGRSPAAGSSSSGLGGDSIASVPSAVNSNAVSGDCVMSVWSEWSRCSVTCGVGYQERKRTILSPAAGGAACPSRFVRRRRCSRAC